MSDTKAHWDNLYATMESAEPGWAQAVANKSLALIRSLDLPKNVSIIDIGGGDSLLADALLEEGYTDVAVLDISAEALEKAKKRLGEKAEKVRWLNCDLTNFRPARPYHLWHDRATFHFFTTPGQIAQYINIASYAIPPGGYMIMGTFSDNGGTESHGLPVKHYTEETLGNTLAPYFTQIGCQIESQPASDQTTQDFLFCRFRRL